MEAVVVGNDHVKRFDVHGKEISIGYSKRTLLAFLIKCRHIDFT